MAVKSCIVTGNQDILPDNLEYVTEQLTIEVENALDDGFKHFICGFAEGIDQLFAEIIIAKRKENEAIRLEAVFPFRERCLNLMEHEKTKALLQACTEVFILREKYSPDAYRLRNRYMVRNADRIIAVYDGREKGNVVSIMRMVHIVRKELRVISLNS